MIVEAQVTINGSRTAVWAAITNIEKASDICSGVDKIEILEKPASGLVGLRWRETRMMFGKPAAVEKRITGAAENEFYQTRAEDSGFVFLTTKRLSESNGSTTLTESHDSLPQTFKAMLTIPMLFLFKGMIRKALLQDLKDIKAAVEKG